MRRVSVIDFGMSRVLRSLPLGKMCNEWCGKAQYAAPEMWLRDAHYDPRGCDVWSLGVVLFVMLFGIPPFSQGAIASDEVFAFMRRQPHGMAAVVAKWRGAGVDLPVVSDEALGLVALMLDPDPMRRLDLKGVLSHPFLFSERGGGSSQ